MGGQISEEGAIFFRKFGPGGPYFLGNLARGGHIFGGAIFPVTPVCFFETISFAATMLFMTNIRFPYIRSPKQFHLHIFIYQLRVSTEKLQEL